MGTREERRFAAAVVAATAGVLAWVLWVCLVVDVREVIGVEPAELGQAWQREPALALVGWVQLVVTWLLPVTVVTASALLLAHLGHRYWVPRSRAVAWAARLVPVVGALGLVAAVSAVVWPGWGFALGAYVAAEELGLAPPTGGVGATRLTTGAVGAGAALAALLGGLVLGAGWLVDRRRRRRAGAPPGVAG